MLTGAIRGSRTYVHRYSSDVPVYFDFLFAQGNFQGRHNMTPTAISQIIEQVVNSGLTVLFEYIMFNYAASRKSATAIYFLNYVWKLSSSSQVKYAYIAAGSAAGTVIAALSSAAFLCVVFFVFNRGRRQQEIRHQVYDGPVIETSYIYKQILRFSIPALISCVATSAIDLIDTGTCIRLMIKGGLSNLTAQALFGIYSTKYQRLMTLATMFVAPLVTAMIPALASALAKHNVRYFRYKIRESYKLIYIVVIPIVAGLTFLAQPIITVIYWKTNSGALMIILGTWTALLLAVQAIQSGILVSP